ncbi:phosphotriesterase [Amycolatopsis sp. GM8]|uniref:phosphotriesterase family protein n=1 Tax=Amycolatopsis sp. GM8 TaxID=2896530 RepID=UPI001F2B7847|nr:phosphotriesterase [Amycolatopsis sp. GM8]
MNAVNTVLGPVDVGELGITLMHEHAMRPPAAGGYVGARSFSPELTSAKVSAATAWLVREDPYACMDNLDLSNEDDIAAEMEIYAAAGGRTLVDNTNGPSRNPAALVRLAQRTGLNIIMGSGWSLGNAQATPTGDNDPEPLAASLVAEHHDGVTLPDGSTVRPGIIGEIAVGTEFTTAQRTTLTAAAIAQREVRVPLLIHLPGWQRRGHEVLDVVLGMGVSPRSVVLCHMDPSGKDLVYQRDLASRGAWLEFDMIGMDANYPGEGQSPSVQDTVDAVTGLIDDGYAGQLLLSQDVSLKTMWTRNGGNGYGYVLKAFIPRLLERGISADTCRGILTDNPAAVFAGAWL